MTPFEVNSEYAEIICEGFTQDEIEYLEVLAAAGFEQ